jgi:hypothetical protein
MSQKDCLLTLAEKRWWRRPTRRSDAVPRLELFPFRYRNPVTGKVGARAYHPR